MTEIKAILFDVDGVLAKHHIGEAYEELARQLNLNPAELSEFNKSNFNDLSLGLITIEQYCSDFQKNFNLPPGIDILSLWREILPAGIERNEELYKMAAHWREKGIRTGIISNVTEMRLIGDRERGLWDGFSPVILSCRVGLRKPDPRIFVLALKELGLPAKNCVYVDDNQKKLEGAKESGFAAGLVFTDNQSLLAELAKLGVSPIKE